MKSSLLTPGFALFLTASVFTAFAEDAKPERGSGPEAAREELKSLKAGEGLAVSLFASEPMVRKPSNMDVDARGRVWIVENVNYRSVSNRGGYLRPEGDRIVILEDTNGDGVADKETTFYQGKDINASLGICVLGNKVIASSGSNVFVFTDTNGDDKADKKEVLFSGISGFDHDHGVHAFVFGPDGKLYFNFGNAGKQLKKPDGTSVIDPRRQRSQRQGQALSRRHGLSLQSRRQRSRNPRL